MRTTPPAGVPLPAAEDAASREGKGRRQESVHILEKTTAEGPLCSNVPLGRLARGRTRACAWRGSAKTAGGQSQAVCTHLLSLGTTMLPAAMDSILANAGLRFRIFPHVNVYCDLHGDPVKVLLLLFFDR